MPWHIWVSFLVTSVLVIKEVEISFLVPSEIITRGEDSWKEEIQFIIL